MQSLANLPAPIPDLETVGYWDLTKAGQLSAQECAACGNKQFPPFATCRRCRSMDLGWSAVSNTGTLYSWTRIHRSPRPEFMDRVPYTLAVIEIDGVTGRYPGLFDVDDLEGPPVIGSLCRVSFEEVTGGFRVPVWHIVHETAGTDR